MLNRSQIPIVSIGSVEIQVIGACASLQGEDTYLLTSAIMSEYEIPIITEDSIPFTLE